MEDGVKDKEDDGVVLSRLVQWFEAAEQASTDAREEAERDRDYYDGKQWTDEEIAKLQKRKQPVVTINRIKPKIDFLRGQEATRRADPKAFPRNPGDESGAFAATDALRYVADEQRWDRKRSECFEDYLIEGATGIDISVYEEQDGGYCIELRRIQWDRMWYDPHSRARDFSDAKYKGQDVWMDVEEALERWPDGKEAIDSTIASESSSQGQTFDDVPRLRWSDPKRKRVRISECWSKEGGKVFHSVFTKAGILSRIESPYKDEKGQPEDGVVYGSCFIDRDGNRYGVVRAWISIQDEINKRRSKAMHLLNVRQTVGERGAVDDVNRAKAELAKPDGHLEITPGMKFDVLPTGDMAAAQFQLLQEAKGEIDAVGVNAALSGNESRVMSGRALMARSEQGLSELGPVFDGFQQFQLDVYRKVWNRIKQFWTGEKWVRVTDDERNVRFVGLNQPMTLGEQLLEELQASGQQFPPEQMQEIMQHVQMDPAMRQVVGTKNNVANLDIDITIDDAPATASLQIEQFQQLAEMAKSGVPIPPDALIEASALRDKDKILEKMQKGGEANPQHQQQMQEMQQAIQSLQQQLQDKAAEQEIKSREVGVKEYAAETDRIGVLAPVDPGMVQQIVQTTLRQLLTSPDISQPQPEPMERPMQQPMQPDHMGMMSRQDMPPDQMEMPHDGMQM